MLPIRRSGSRSSWGPSAIDSCPRPSCRSAAPRQEQANIEYRTELIGSTLGSLTVWRNPTPDPQQSYLLSQLTLTDIASEPALMASKQGVGGLLLWLGLLAVLVVATITAWQRRDYPLLSPRRRGAGAGAGDNHALGRADYDAGSDVWLIVACVATSSSADRDYSSPVRPRRAIRSR